MPRDLTDLMERATSFAPPEPHAAADITRLATRRQRRRTTGFAAGLAVAVVAVTGIGYGATRGHGTTPQPAGPWKYGQHHTLADATPSADAPWFHTYDYPVSSVLPAGGGLAAVPEYLGIDSQGRLAAMRAHRTGAQSQYLSAKYLVVDGPRGPVHDVPAPPFGLPRNLMVALSFTVDDRLLWNGNGGNGLVIKDQVTDLDGKNPVVIDRNTHGVPGRTDPLPHSVRSLWYDGGRVWFTALTKDDFPKQDQWVSLFSFDPAHPSALRAEKPQNASAIEMAGGEAVWLDGSTVRAEDLGTGDVHVVHVPIDPGCHVPPVTYFSGGFDPDYLATDGDLVSLVEPCKDSSHVVVTDLDGRLVADVDSGTGNYAVETSLTGDLLVLAGGDHKEAGAEYGYALDLTTGRFVRLGDTESIHLPGRISGAGRYVLWYDRSGGHVGELGG